MNDEFPFSQEEVFRVAKEYMMETYGPVGRASSEDFYMTRFGMVCDAMSYLRDRSLLAVKPKRKASKA